MMQQHRYYGLFSVASRATWPSLSLLCEMEAI